MIWGLLPIYLLSQHFTITQVGIIAAVYPTVWGFRQLFTGKMSDLFSKKKMLVLGMLLQRVSIIAIPYLTNFCLLVLLAVLLGFGTALVYPTFLNTIAQNTHPTQRAESIGAFRLWRDLGYVFGVILSGLTADKLGIEYAIILIGIITILSSFIVQFRMKSKTN